jgi:hypothetical protein
MDCPLRGQVTYLFDGMSSPAEPQYIENIVNTVPRVVMSHALPSYRGKQRDEVRFSLALARLMKIHNMTMLSLPSSADDPKYWPSHHS